MEEEYAGFMADETYKGLESIVVLQENDGPELDVKLEPEDGNIDYEDPLDTTGCSFDHFTIHI